MLCVRSSLEMIAENMNAVLCMSHSRYSVLRRKSGKGNPGESRVELEHNKRAKHFSLSAEDKSIPY